MLSMYHRAELSQTEVVEPPFSIHIIAVVSGLFFCAMCFFQQVLGGVAEVILHLLLNVHLLKRDFLIPTSDLFR